MLIKLTSRDYASNHYVNLFAIGMLVPNDGGAWARITLSTGGVIDVSHSPEAIGDLMRQALSDAIKHGLQKNNVA